MEIIDSTTPEVSIVIPLYNEEQVLPTLIERLNLLRKSADIRFEFVLIDDGSSDDTAAIIRSVGLTDPGYKTVFLSRNFGHQIAVSVGMAEATASRAVMIIDGDLQDPPELVFDFYRKIKEGFEIVYAVRKTRKEHFVKRFMYKSFYRILNAIIDIKIPLDSGDFCMISRRVNDILVSMPEQNRFVRGLRGWVGFRQYGYEYDRAERFAGKSKYSLKKLFQLAYDGIYNFSEFPLKIILKLGVFTLSVSFVYFLYIVAKKIFYPDSVPQGFATIIIFLIFFCGVQLVCLGIMAEYLSRIHKEVKSRPLYIIKSKIENTTEIPIPRQWDAQ